MVPQLIDPATLKQLESLAPVSRPLLICDVDEVILHLVEPFEQLLGEHGLVLGKKVIKLNGNVFHKSDGREADQEKIWSVLNHLFEEQAERQMAVDGVAGVLADLANTIDIILLTNLPHKYGDARRKYLADIQIPYPLVTNSGAKGPPVKWLADWSNQNTVFIDDTGHHLESVGNYSPDTSLIHFMADDVFREMTRPGNSVLLSSGNWHETGQTVRSVLTG